MHITDYKVYNFKEKETKIKLMAFILILISYYWILFFKFL